MQIQATALRPFTAFADVATGKRGLKRGLLEKHRLAILFLDTTWFTQVPPLRACWSKIGEQLEVPIVGAMTRVGLTGVLSIKTGRFWLYGSKEYDVEAYEEVLINIRRLWRGWTIVLFVDKHSAHTSPKAKEFAKGIGIEVRELPTASSQYLNPVDTLWRTTKQWVANEPTPNLKRTIIEVCEHLKAMMPKQRLKAAGVLSEKFWLKEFL